MTRIGIDLERRIGTVDPRIFGQFIEHLGRCIYGGIYDEGSPLSDARGFRRDVLEAARPLRVPRAPLARRQLRQRLSLARRRRARGPAPASQRARLVRRGVEPLRHRRVHRVLPRARGPSPTSA